MGTKFKLKKKGIDRVDFTLPGDSVGQYVFEKINPASNRDYYLLKTGFYRINSGERYLSVQSTETSDAPAIAVTLTQESFVNEVETVRAYASIIEAEPFALMSHWRSEIPSFAKNLCQRKLPCSTVLAAYTNADPLLPEIAESISRDFHENSIAVLILLSKAFEKQNKNVNVKRTAFGSIDTHPGTNGLEVRLYEARNSPYLEEVKTICQESKLGDNQSAWQKLERCWVVDRKAFDRLKNVCDWDISDMAQASIRSQKNDDVIEESKISPCEHHYKGMHPVLLEATTLMLSRCDGANSLDGAGFNGLDSAFFRTAMNQYAEVGSIEFSLQSRMAKKLGKYRRQLSGITIPSSDEIRSYLKKCNVPCYDGRLSVCDDGHGGFLGVSFEYEETMKEKVKSVCQGHKANDLRIFNRETGCWQLCLSGLEEILGLEYEWDKSAEIEAILSGEQTLDDFRAIKPLSKEEIEEKERKTVVYSERHKGNPLEVRFPYSPIVVDIVKEFSGVFRKTANFGMYWLIESVHTFELYKKLEPLGFEFEDEVMRTVQSQKQLSSEDTSESRKAIVKQLIEAAKLDDTLPNGWTVLEHQKKAVEWIFNRIYERHDVPPALCAGILALDMGLGKTLISLLAAKAYREVFPDVKKVIVVCPAFLIPNWKEESAKLDLGFTPYIYSYARQPTENAFNEPFILIADEAHYIGNPKSARSKKMTAIKDHPNLRMALPMTGTPMKNGLPKELYPLLDLCSHRLSKNKKLYFKYYCDAQVKSMGRKRIWWDSGARNLDELFRSTQDVMLRMEKDVLDLPDKVRIFRPVDISKASKKAYDQRHAELKADYLKRIKEGKISSDGAHMVELLHLRLAGSIAKTEYAIQIAEESANQGSPVVLFTEYKETAYAVQEALGRSCGIITGDQTAKARQSTKNDFQDGNLRFLVCTSKAGGVGLTLTKASSLIMIDRPWTPGDAVQCEDRIFRIGQTKSVFIFWLQYGIDSKVDTLLDDKEQRIQKVLTGKRKTLRGVRSVASAAASILQKEFGKAS